LKVESINEVELTEEDKVEISFEFQNAVNEVLA
jgi:hypothetical protein